MPCLNYREGGRHHSCVLLVILFYNVKSCVKRLEDGGSFEEWFLQVWYPDQGASATPGNLLEMPVLRP